MLLMKDHRKNKYNNVSINVMDKRVVCYYSRFVSTRSSFTVKVSVEIANSVQCLCFLDAADPSLAYEPVHYLVKLCMN